MWASLSVGIEGVEVAGVERCVDGSLLVTVVTARDVLPGCPACGVVSGVSKGVVYTRPRDLPFGGSPARLRWVKRRWRCVEEPCRVGSFTEVCAQIPKGVRTTGRLRERAGALVVDCLESVVQAGRHTGLSWPVVWHAALLYGAGVVDAAPGTPGRSHTGLTVVTVLGIDEIRRGRPVWEKNVRSGKWELVTDRWHVGFTDVAGGAGMLGQVEGRKAQIVVNWLDAQGEDWKEQVTHVTIDMCTVFLSAIRTALPRARTVVDRFHLVQLADNTLDEVRCRITHRMRDRRGRTGDIEGDLRNKPRRNRENLRDKDLARIDADLRLLGPAFGAAIRAAWDAKEALRDLLSLAATHAPRTVTSRRRTRFLQICADSGVKELIKLAGTVERWWHGIEALLETGYTNAASEGHNRTAKLIARIAFGFRNAANQRLRVRWATTRRSRGLLTNPG